MAPSASCSHWWHAPFYIAATIAILTAAFSSPPTSTTTTTTATTSSAASLALHRSGFHLTAAILQVSPDTLPSSSAFTFFALPDPAVSNYSLLHGAHDLFRCHTLPVSLPFADLAKKPPGSCLPTLLPGRDLVITTTSSSGLYGAGAVRVNGVPITHPDLFLDGSHVIHGVGGRIPKGKGCGRVAVRWDRVIRVLSANGFMSFAVGLNSVMDAVSKEYDRLAAGGGAAGGVTVFAPRDEGFEYVASSRPLLQRVVGAHVAVGRLAYEDLAGMKGGEGIQTVGGGGGGGVIRVTAADAEGGPVEVNGVVVADPDLHIEEGFVVHGLVRAIEY